MDPYLKNLLEDVQSVTNGFFNCIQIILGLCYYCGKNLSDLFTFITYGIWNILVNTYQFLELLFFDLVDFEKSLIKGVYLTYVGIGKIIEAFQITFIDFGNYLIDLKTSLIISTGNYFDNLKNVCWSLSTIPYQLTYALELIGDSFLSFIVNLYGITCYVIHMILISPIKAIIYSWKFITYIIAAQYRFFTTISLSSQIGLFVIILTIILYKKINVFRTLWEFLKLSLLIVKTLIRLPYTLFYLFRRLITKGAPIDESITLSGSENKTASCVICHENQVAFIANPCNHVCLCSTCVHRIVEIDSKCPICRYTVDTYSRVYIP